MRKLRRAVLRRKAESYGGKTIKIFRYLWKDSRNREGKKVPGQPVIKKSMAHRFLNRILGR